MTGLCTLAGRQSQQHETYSHFITTVWMIMDYRYFIHTADLGILFRSKIALTVKKATADWRPRLAVSMYVVTLYLTHPPGDSNDAGIFHGSMYLNGKEYVPVSIFFFTVSLPMGTKYEVQNRQVITKDKMYYVWYCICITCVGFHNINFLPTPQFMNKVRNCHVNSYEKVMFCVLKCLFYVFCTVHCDM